MTSVKNIYDFLNSYAPVELQEDYDNAGFLCGKLDNCVNKVILALDATSDVISEAKEKGAELIITHHPLIWGKLSKVTGENTIGNKLFSLINNDISVISMHTNLDKILVNQVLIKSLAEGEYKKINDFMYSGCLDKPICMKQYLSICRDVLKNEGLRYYDSGKPVYKIACIGGAGDEGLYEAYIAGCDTYVTADIRHHVFLEAKELGINLIDGDHFNTENLAMISLANMLSKEFADVQFSVAESNLQVVHYA